MFYAGDYNSVLGYSIYTFYCVLITFFLFLLIPVRIPKVSTSTNNYTCLYNIYFLKILFTYCIVLHHIFIHLQIWNNAEKCVEFFFIISGFMLLYTYNPQKSIYRFIFSRFILFVPYLFFSNLLSLYSKGSIDFPKFFSGVFLFSSTPFYPHHAYYMPSWYLVILFWVSIFYFIFINKRWGIYVIIGITLFTLPIMCFYDGSIEIFNSIVPWLTNGMIRGLACIGLGYCIALIYKYIHIPYISYTKYICTFLEIFLLIYILAAMFCSPFKTKIYILLMCFTLLFILFLLKKGGISTFFNHTLFEKLARFSLPIFMTHDVIIPTFIYNFDFLQPFSTLMKIILLLIFSTVYGIFTYYMFLTASKIHQYLFSKFKHKKKLE